MKVIALDQGSQAWLAWRSDGIGGSDAPVILGTSPWKKPFDLYEEKLGKPRPSVHPRQAAAMQRGHDLEPVARAKVEALLGLDLVPLCGEHDEYPWMRLSSDGASIDGSVLTEIKCPGAKDYGVAKAGKIPPKYEGQLQHSLAVSGADLLVYASFRPEENPEPILIEVKPDHAYLDRLFRMEEAFWKAVQDRDWSLFDSVATGSLPDGFAEIAAEYREVAQLLSEVSDREKALKKVLLSTLVGEGSLAAYGVEVTRSKARGSIDYAKAVKELGIEADSLECFRKPDSKRESVRVLEKQS